MKNIKIILAIAIQILLINFLYAQSMVNNGAKIVTLPGTSLVIDGTYINKLGGNILNSGNINISGHWVNDAISGNLLQGSTGAVNFTGPGSQIIEGFSTTYFYDLNIQSNVEIHTNTSVQNHLILSTFNTYLLDADLQMEAGSSIIGGGPLAYVSTIGTGRLIQRVGDWEQVFPVGTISSFSPIAMHNHIGGSDDFYFVNVFPDVLDGGTSGSTISEINDCVNLTWNIEKMFPATLDLSITTQWNASDEGINFDRNHCGLGHYMMGSGWIPQPESNALGTNPYEMSRTGITSLSAFAVGDLESPMAAPLGLRLDLTVLLEGPYDDFANMMATNLYASSYIPLGQPYFPSTPYYGNTSPVWLYPGGENVPNIPADVVDWVIVQLRDATSPGAASSATILDMQAAFVLANGSIVGLNGSSLLEFPVSVVNDLYIVIYHRNHLGIISNSPPIFSGGTYTYDFSSGGMQVFGGASGHKEVEPGVWAMIAADGDADGKILPSDETNAWVVDVNNSGYLGGDFNMNGLGQPQDKTGYWIPNANKAGQVPSMGENIGYQSQIPD